MSDQNLADIIDGILSENKRPFMTVKSLITKMTIKDKRIFGLFNLVRPKDIRRVLEERVGDRFIFSHKGTIIYIAKPCQPVDLVLAEMSHDVGVSPKNIARFMPFPQKDFSAIINDLSNAGRIRIIFNEQSEPRLFLAENESKPTPISRPENESHYEVYNQPAIPANKYTREIFKSAFDEFNKKRHFVRICDLRRKLKWPDEVFDDMLKNLRDEGIIQLQVGDASTMTPDEVRDSFIDENKFRMSLVTWNDR